MYALAYTVRTYVNAMKKPHKLFFREACTYMYVHAHAHAHKHTHIIQIIHVSGKKGRLNEPMLDPPLQRL